MSNYISEIYIGENLYKYFDINKACAEHGFEAKYLPYSLKILLENILRNYSDREKINEALGAFKNFIEYKKSDYELQFLPSRVLMQDFTGVPAIVDLVAMREAITKLGGNPEKINPKIQVDLVIDHSIQVDFAGNNSSYEMNNKKEIERNLERYKFLKWAQKSFTNLRVVPPSSGICHQVNLEHLATVISREGDLLYPDSVVGTDSHTTMINGLSVLGWGVGGIEAEAAMLNQPIPIILPEIIGFKLTGKLSEGVTATDLVLKITKILRDFGVVGKFVEYFGDGVKNLSLADRATISNMSPEYGATCGFFAIDEKTIEYLELTGRDKDHINLIKEYAKIQDLWSIDNSEATYSELIELDIGSVRPAMAGPKRPQDLVLLEDVKSNFSSSLKAIAKVDDIHKKSSKLQNGSIVIAAITSCTNTSNPYVMIGAGLVAKKAVELGLVKQNSVKTSLAPGSQVVTEYLNKAGLTKYLDELGFNLVGYGCTTCIGNSGPLDPEIERVIAENNLKVASILSGNRNFEGRVHPLVWANYLASPPLVVAYSLVGHINIDITKESLGIGYGNKEIFLKDIWPSSNEIEAQINKFLNREIFIDKYSNIYQGDDNWKSIETSNENIYKCAENNTYIKNSPFLDNIKSTSAQSDIKDARILAIFGDSFTTDHISPAGNIAKDSPAAKYLKEMGVNEIDFNSYGSRRGNHEVMMRGTFANVRIKNKICPELDGGFTKYFPENKSGTIYEIAMKYKEDKIPLIVFAGKEYGTGSSRDWAAKGPKLLGVRAIIAESFERIHRSNLIGMGIFPLKLQGETIESLNLCGDELVTITGIEKGLEKGALFDCIIRKGETIVKKIQVQLCSFADNEIEYIKAGGILNKVVKDLGLYN